MSTLATFNLFAHGTNKFVCRPSQGDFRIKKPILRDHFWVQPYCTLYSIRHILLAKICCRVLSKF